MIRKNSSNSGAFEDPFNRESSKGRTSSKRSTSGSSRKVVWGLVIFCLILLMATLIYTCGGSTPSIMWYPDADQDGYGDTYGAVMHQVEQPNGYVDKDGDVDDSDPCVPTPCAESKQLVQSFLIQYYQHVDDRNLDQIIESFTIPVDKYFKFTSVTEPKLKSIFSRSFTKIATRSSHIINSIELTADTAGQFFAKVNLDYSIQYYYDSSTVYTSEVIQRLTVVSENDSYQIKSIFEVESKCKSAGQPCYTKNGLDGTITDKCSCKVSATQGSQSQTTPPQATTSVGSNLVNAKGGTPSATVSSSSAVTQSTPSVVIPTTITHFADFDGDGLGDISMTKEIRSDEHVSTNWVVAAGDNCPQRQGALRNNGCPEIEIEVSGDGYLYTEDYGLIKAKLEGSDLRDDCVWSSDRLLLSDQRTSTVSAMVPHVGTYPLSIEISGYDGFQASKSFDIHVRVKKEVLSDHLMALANYGNYKITGLTGDLSARKNDSELFLDNSMQSQNISVKKLVKGSYFGRSFAEMKMEILLSKRRAETLVNDIRVINIEYDSVSGKISSFTYEQS